MNELELHGDMEGLESVLETLEEYIIRKEGELESMRDLMFIMQENDEDWTSLYYKMEALESDIDHVSSAIYVLEEDIV